MVAWINTRFVITPMLGWLAMVHTYLYIWTMARCVLACRWQVPGFLKLFLCRHMYACVFESTTSKHNIHTRAYVRLHKMPKRYNLAMATIPGASIHLVFGALHCIRYDFACIWWAKYILQKQQSYIGQQGHWSCICTDTYWV